MAQDHRIVIVSELFYPDTTSTAHILTRVADHLSGNFRVEVLAGPESYVPGSGTLRNRDDDKPYAIERIVVGSYYKNKLLSRAIKLAVTTMKLGWSMWRKCGSDDSVLIVTNPAPLLIAASVIKKFRKFSLNILVHDVFPENAVAAGIVKSPDGVAYKLMRNIFRRAYQSADRLIVIGRDMKDVFESKLRGCKRQPEITVIENWADKPLTTSQGSAFPQGKINILYAGNIGRCQGIESFIDAFEAAANPDLRFVIRGSGALEDKIGQQISRSESDIVLGGRFSRSEQFDILAGCDLSLVTLAPGMYGLGVPSKSYNIMAAGKPILYIGDLRSEIARTILDYDLGYCFDPDDSEGLVKWLKTLAPDYRAEFEAKGANALRLAYTTYSEDVILAKFSKLFSE